MDTWNYVEDKKISEDLFSVEGMMGYSLKDIKPTFMTAVSPALCRNNNETMEKLLLLRIHPSIQQLYNDYINNNITVNTEIM